VFNVDNEQTADMIIYTKVHDITKHCAFALNTEMFSADSPH